MTLWNVGLLFHVVCEDFGSHTGHVRNCGLMGLNERSDQTGSNTGVSKGNMAEAKANLIMSSGVDFLYDIGRHNLINKHSEAFQSQKNSSSWADRSENSSALMHAYNLSGMYICNAIFFVVKCIENDFNKMSFFL